MKHEEMLVVGGNAFSDASKAFIDVILLLLSYDVIAMKLAKNIASRLPKNEKCFLFYLKIMFFSFSRWACRKNGVNRKIKLIS